MKKPVIKKISLLVCCGLLLTFMFTIGESSVGNVSKPVPKDSVAAPAVNTTAMLYDSLALDSVGLSREAFTYAMKGYKRLLSEGKLVNSRVISIVDFSLPSSKKRLFIIDLEAGKLLFNTLVAHGRNSGLASATSFSNRPESFKSSLGFYITGGTYRGEHGYSLKLLGTERGINDNALSRGIVMHSADYVNEKLALSRGWIGRSLGCPAIPKKVHKKVIELIKNGTCLFIYGPDKYYLTNSALLSVPDNVV